MSDLDLSNPYDPDAFERRSERGPRPLPPAADRPQTVADAGPLPDPPAAPPAPPEEKAAPGAVPWKAAASSVPKLRQQPVSLAAPAAEESFKGFTQDEIEGHGHVAAGARRDAGDALDDDPAAKAGPLAKDPPAWEIWLERARAIPLPLVLGACGVVLLAVILAFVLRPREQASVTLAHLRQHPEAYDGRRVAVSGRAGEVFSVGGSYVFNLRQGRDTIVVYSRSRRPSLHEKLQATGTVSIGYLDGVPRVALFEEQQAP